MGYRRTPTNRWQNECRQNRGPRTHAAGWSRLVSSLVGREAVNEAVATRVHFGGRPEEAWDHIMFYEEVPGRAWPCIRTPSAIAGVEEIRLPHGHVRQVLPNVPGFALNPALLLVFGRTLEPRLTTAAFLLRPGLDLRCGGSQLRFWKPAETPPLGAARPLTLFLSLDPASHA